MSWAAREARVSWQMEQSMSCAEYRVDGALDGAGTDIAFGNVGSLVIRKVSSLVK